MAVTPNGSRSTRTKAQPLAPPPAASAYPARGVAHPSGPARSADRIARAGITRERDAPLHRSAAALLGRARSDTSTDGPHLAAKVGRAAPPLEGADALRLIWTATRTWALTQSSRVAPSRWQERRHVKGADPPGARVSVAAVALPTGVEGG